MLVRQARLAEADMLALILRTSMRTAMPFLPDLHTPEEDRRFLREVVLATCEVWVAELDGLIAGFVAVGDELVEHLYVLPEHQRSGVGTALLDHAKERRPGGFTLWTFQGNDGARRFYERHGLRAICFTDGEQNEEKTPDVQYEWRPPVSSASA
jgi:putative acetyltransferase